MNQFNQAFGTDIGKVKKHCIFLPFGERAIIHYLAVKERYKGMFFDLIDTEEATVVCLKKGALAADAVLLLNESKCEEIILFGSCGVTVPHTIGDTFVIKEAYNLESPTDMMQNPHKINIVKADTYLIDIFNQKFSDRVFYLAKTATVGSLVLEEGFKHYFRENDIACVDMEASTVYSSAKAIKCKAIALFYASDIIGKIPYHVSLSDEDKKKIKKARDTLIKLIIKYVKAN